MSRAMKAVKGWAPADLMNRQTLRLITDALQAKADECNARSAALPREYSTGVTSDELRMHGLWKERAEEYRNAKKIVTAFYSRHTTTKETKPHE